MKLYVVTTNTPGPGASAMVKHTADELREQGYIVGMVDELAAAANGACEFVELEDADGHGVGPASGVEWSDHPTADGLKRLGPFVAPLTERELDAVSTALDGYADMTYDGAKDPAAIDEIVALATAARKLGLDSLADHWDGKADELRHEFGVEAPSA